MSNTQTETGFKSILCGVDGTDEANRAAAVAARLAKTFDARLTFLAVTRAGAQSESLDKYRRAEGLDPSEPVPMLAAEAEACLDAALQVARDAGVNNAKRAVRTGKVAEAILSLGKELETDTVVLGHHPRSSVVRFVKSPVSSSVADKSSMMIVLVP